MIELFDPTDPKGDDEAAEEAVEDEDTLDDDADGLDDSSDDESRAETTAAPAQLGPPAFSGLCNERRAALKAKNPGKSPREIGQMLEEEWRQLEPAVRSRYAAEAATRPKQKVRGKAQHRPKGPGRNAGRPKKAHAPKVEGE